MYDISYISYYYIIIYLIYKYITCSMGATYCIYIVSLMIRNVVI